MAAAAEPAIDPKPFIQAGFAPRSRVPLSELGTFRLGGPVQWLIECASPRALAEIRRIALARNLRPLLIGEGSNLLFSDQGWPGMLIRFAGGGCSPVDEGEGDWRFAASENLQRVVDWSTERGFAGLEAFNGIPGTLGGAVVGNAGAWGVQLEHVLREVRGVNAAGETQTLGPEECGFSYRDSALKHNGFWVTEVVLRLRSGNTETLRAERRRILDLRAARHPDMWKQPCIGSFFKNLEPTSKAERRQAAGYFLEQAGAKQCRVGGAAVYAGHANILVKAAEDCKAADVAALARKLRQAVKDKYGLDLVREVRYLGEIPGECPQAGFY